MPQIKGLQAKALSSNHKRIQFVDATTAGMAATHTFKFAGENLIYVIGSIISASELELVVEYNGAKPFDVFHPFQVSTDFTVNVGLIKPAAGDVDIRDYMSKNFDKIDQLFDFRWYVDNATGDLLPDVPGVRSIGNFSQRVLAIWLSGNVELGGDITLPAGFVINFGNGARLYSPNDTTGDLVYDRTVSELVRLLSLGGMQLRERAADPPAPVANSGIVYLRDNGSGKTQLCVRFPTGAVQVLATEP